jgi:uncharacterized protein (TIGR03118 family)
MKRIKSLMTTTQGLVIMLFTLIFSVGCQKTETRVSPDSIQEEMDRRPQIVKDFEQVNLVSNVAGEYNAARIDPKLVNAWGIAFSSNGIAWLGSQGGGVSTVYNQFGADARPAVAIPSPGGPTGGNPTGVVFSGSGTDFILSNGQPARFIFVGVDGIISGWNAAAGNTALLIKNNVATSAYTGLALASNAGNNFLYAADFRAGRIDVYDKNFIRVMNMPFVDPSLPAGYSPFNIERIGSQLYVMYAKVGPDGRDEKSPGNGYVSVFNTDGSFVKRFISRGQLNAPWGIAKAPAGFWGEGTDNPENVILVGNFGDGRINAFAEDGSFQGQLRQHGNPIIIDGLWAISFAPLTATAIDPNKLFFAAGPAHERDGLFGYIHK